ncbi:MAG: pilus assembly FimT family protein [Bacteriovorax sp.]
MRKLFKNNRGFTLAEMMVATAIAGVIATIVVSSLKYSTQTINRGLITSEESGLKNAIIQNMSNPTACANTFGGQVFSRSDFDLKDSHGNIFVSKSPPYNSFGETAVRKFLTVTSITSAPTPGSSNSLTLTVTYVLDAGFTPGKKQLTKTFSVNIFMVKNIVGGVATGTVKDCFADVSAMIIAAVKNACLSSAGNAAVYETEVVFPPYGRCIHTPQVLKEDANPAPAGLCPAGQFLVASTSDANGLVTYQCKRFLTAPCPANQYLNGIDTSGNPMCKDFITLFTNGMALSYNGTSYQSINLNCGTDMVLRYVDASGAPHCVPKVIIQTCPAGQYISDVDASGNVTCSYFTKKTAGVCPAGQYLTAINSDGSVPAGGCADLSIPASCPTNWVVRGADSSGNAICEPSGP